MNQTNNEHSLTYEQLSTWWAELIGCSLVLEGIADSVDNLMQTTLNSEEIIQQMILSVRRRMDAVVSEMDYPGPQSGPVPIKPMETDHE